MYTYILFIILQDFDGLVSYLYATLLIFIYNVFIVEIVK